MDVGFATSEKVWREEKKKKSSADYNGSLALAYARAGDHNYLRVSNLISYTQDCVDRNGKLLSVIVQASFPQFSLNKSRLHAIYTRVQWWRNCRASD